jgi:hypothetical protein
VTATIDYLYCVVPADAGTSALPLTSAPHGVDDRPVRAVTVGAIVAITSALEASAYESEAMPSRVGNVEWVMPRAMAHDRIVTWVSDRVDAVVPMPMWALYSGDAALREALLQQSATLEAALRRVAGAREYNVRLVARRDGVAASLATLSEGVAELERAVAAATPGQAYLLSRKLAAATQAEVRHVVTRAGDELLAVLSVHAKAVVRDPLPKAEGDTIPVVNAAFLVQQTLLDPFRHALTEWLARYESVGFHCEFTGPWPPYHFVRDR